MIAHFQGAQAGANARALVEQLKRALAEAEQNAQQLSTMRVVTNRLPEGQEPTAMVEYLEDGILITFGIPDGATGPQGEAFTYDDFTAEQLQALRGKDGEDGQDGDDGYSPTVKVQKIEGGYKITITDKDGPKTFDVLDGKDGQDGQDGDDGVSPIVEVEKIEGGHRVTVTDKNGSQSFDVMDGSGAEEDGGGFGEATDMDTADVPDGFKVYGTAETIQSGNLFDGKLEYGYYDNETGEAYDNEYCVRSANFIPVRGGSEIFIVNDKGYYNPIVIEYDENKVCTGDIYSQTAEKYQLRDDTRYVMFNTDDMANENDLSARFVVAYSDSNLFDGKMELGTIDTMSGAPEDEVDSVRSANFTPVTGGHSVAIFNDKNYQNNVMEYDENKAFVRRGFGEQFFELHANTRYIKVFSDFMSTENDVSVQYFVFDATYEEPIEEKPTYAVELKKYVQSLLDALPSETWIGTLEDGSTVEKVVLVR